MATRDETGEHFQNLEVLAVLLTEVKVEPAKLAVYTDATLRHDVTVTDLRPKTLRVTRALFASPHLGATVAAVPATATAPASYRITVEVRGSLPEGQHEDVLCIATDDPVYRELRVPVSVVKCSRQCVSPRRTGWNSTIPRGQPAPSRVVVIRAGNGDEEVVVDRVEADDPALRCRWVQGPGKMATLRVSVDHTRVKDVLNSAVRVYVSKPAATVLTIPVVCRTR